VKVAVFALAIAYVAFQSVLGRDFSPANIPADQTIYPLICGVALSKSCGLDG
jgi:hypothetical protein